MFRRIQYKILSRGLINIARVQRLLRAFVTLYAYACIPFRHVTHALLDPRGPAATRVGRRVNKAGDSPKGV